MAIQIIKVPGINGLGKTKGCELAGNMIIDELNNIYSSEQGKIIDVKLLNLEEIHLDNGNLELTNKVIYENALESFDKDRVIFLGGDHSISCPLVKAFKDYCKSNKKESCLIVFDAHPDCMPLSSEFPTHEEWLRACVESGFSAENILIVGLRNSYRDEIEFLNKNRIKTIPINSLLIDLEETCDYIMEFASGKVAYLSIDIDIVDPVFAPATGYREVGGLTSRELIYLVQRINKMRNLKAVDIVEINPEIDISVSKTCKNLEQVSDGKVDKDYGLITCKLGAKVLAELI